MNEIQEKVLRVSCDWTFSFEDLLPLDESCKRRNIYDYKGTYFESVYLCRVLTEKYTYCPLCNHRFRLGKCIKD